MIFVAQNPSFKTYIGYMSRNSGIGLNLAIKRFKIDIITLEHTRNISLKAKMMMKYDQGVNLEAMDCGSNTLINSSYFSLKFVSLLKFWSTMYELCCIYRKVKGTARTVVVLLFGSIVLTSKRMFMSDPIILGFIKY